MLGFGLELCLLRQINRHGHAIDYQAVAGKYGMGKTYRPETDVSSWDMRHQPPGTTDPGSRTGNVMPDLANAMKTNPNLKVLLNAGYST
jgi:hypothetical protein